MKPVVYLYEQQLKELPFSSGNQNVAGYANSWDDDTVFHAHPLLAKVKPGAFAIRCTFFLSNSPDSFPASEKDIIALDDGDKGTLLIFLAKGKNQFQHKIFLKTENSWIGCEVKFVPEKSDLYSRSKGLLETEALAKKTVGIVGLGSGGSHIAIELGKSGIGKFVLIDFDRIELSNVARHVCGINDLGRFKTFAVRDAILQKNPFTEIKTLEIDITKQREECSEALSKVDLIIAASDNDRSRFFLNELSLKHSITSIFGRALTRAIGGDVMRVRPHEGPCYNCLYSQNIRTAGSEDEEISQKQQAEKLLPDYTSEKEMQAVIQVGLSSDIAPITNLMVKLALVELSKGISTGISNLEEDFESDFYLWANRRENLYENWSQLGFNFNKPSILRWYGAKVERDPNCMVCGD